DDLPDLRVLRGHGRGQDDDAALVVLERIERGHAFGRMRGEPVAGDLDALDALQVILRGEAPEPVRGLVPGERLAAAGRHRAMHEDALLALGRARDRKSTRLNSSHVKISYAVFCLKKKRKRLHT